ncbi:MAG: hypothetical protein WBS20_12465 [Lysobacterales bacterium]
MKGHRNLALIILSAVLSNCASTPDVAVGDTGKLDIKTLQGLLPGAYSNFAQVHDEDSDLPVTDIGIRQLKTSGEPVFLFTNELRNQGKTSHDLYWLKLDRKTGQAAFHFTRLADEELSLPMQDILSIAWQRVVPGCVMPVRRVGEHFIAQTNPDTCVFAQPLQGETRLVHSLSIGEDVLMIRTKLQIPGGQESGDGSPLVLQKHRGFVGWASIRIETRSEQDEPGEWQLSQVFNTRDDGRVSHLYDQAMTPMEYGLQLARLPRFDGEPAYFQLSVINLENGQTQAFQWFEPGSEILNLNLDWFQANLERIGAADLLP